MSGLTMAMCVPLFVRLRRVPFAYAMSRDTGCPEETTLHGVNLHRPAYWRKRGITCDEGTCSLVRQLLAEVSAILITSAARYHVSRSI